MTQINMMLRVFIVCLLAALCVVSARRPNCPTKPKPNYKVTKISIQDVGVSCLNGQPPDVQKLGHTVVVSCDAQ